MVLQSFQNGREATPAVQGGVVSEALARVDSPLRGRVGPFKAS